MTTSNHDLTISVLPKMRATCPACGSKQYRDGKLVALPYRFCSHKRPIRAPWYKLWRRCSLHAPHLHQSCPNCEATWLAAMVENFELGL